jgi:hypothetical protein
VEDKPIVNVLIGWMEQSNGFPLYRDSGCFAWPMHRKRRKEVTAAAAALTSDPLLLREMVDATMRMDAQVSVYAMCNVHTFMMLEAHPRADAQAHDHSRHS